MPKLPPEPPPEVAELAACLGVAGALKLIEVYGGVRLHVPTPARAHSSVLSTVLDDGELQRFCAAFGGNRIAVPLAREWRVRMLLHAGGRSHSEIARLTGSTVSWVSKISWSGWTPKARAHKGARKKRDESAAERQLRLTLA